MRSEWRHFLLILPVFPQDKRRGALPRRRQKRNVPLARKLRGTMSLPEVLLWQRLHPSDAKFRRQHPLGRYVLDFYCASARICVEVDGISHNMGDSPSRDAVRNAWIEAQGVTVLRVSAAEVLRNPDVVADQIVRFVLGCNGTPPSIAGAIATSPFVLRKNGEDQGRMLPI